MAGNVRELRNVAEQAMIMSATETVMPEALPIYRGEERPGIPERNLQPDRTEELRLDWEENLQPNRTKDPQPD